MNVGTLKGMWYKPLQVQCHPQKEGVVRPKGKDAISG